MCITVTPKVERFKEEHANVVKTLKLYAFNHDAESSMTYVVKRFTLMQFVW